MNNSDVIATTASVRNGQVMLGLLDGSTHSFPIHFYPRLAAAAPSQLSAVKLRVGGRALRWDALDEDIWVADAVLGRYPASLCPVAA
ncbi:MAG: DUF2442 domain-containing protein [bacterium]